jgi:glycosyltransferase involved in cell wall biosynthesis
VLSLQKIYNKMLSVIIPIYNSEQYLKACLDSLISQTCNDFEVILIDDGSTDDSAQICKKYCSANSNFKYFYQKNAGPSAARNTGLKYVTGEFISFIDSDDYVATDYVETILKNMKYDILFFGIILQQNNGRSRCCTFNDSNNITLFDLLMTQSDDCAYAFMVSKCFRKDIIISNHLQFDERLHHFEDQAFTLEYIQKAKRISSISKSIYYYNYGIGISSINPKLDDYTNINIKMFKILKEYKNKDVINYLKIRIINYCFSAFVNNRCCLSYSYHKANEYIEESSKAQLKRFLLDHSYDRHITVNKRVERFVRVVLADKSSVMTKLRLAWLSFYEWQREITKKKKHKR